MANYEQRMYLIDWIKKSKPREAVGLFNTASGVTSISFYAISDRLDKLTGHEYGRMKLIQALEDKLSGGGFKNLGWYVYDWQQNKISSMTGEQLKTEICSYAEGIVDAILENEKHFSYYYPEITETICKLK